MNILNKIKVFVADAILNYPHYIINSFIYMFSRRTIQINAWVIIKYGNVKKRNWGDDINVFLLEKITNKKVVVINQSLFHRFAKKINYICIGSILGLYENEQSIIWGTGFIGYDKKLLCKPYRICSVRGKYTRELLMKLGYECPPVYGDPALLISKFYIPPKKECHAYKIGFILHYVDASNIVVNDYVKKNSDCIIISLSNYEKWTDVIDKICSCEFIISSSLHGLIVSDTYGIANVWVRLSEDIVGGNFKFLDYFSSVDRKEIEPNMITSMSDIDDLYESRNLYKKPCIDYDKIMESCPFIESFSISN